MEIIGLFVAIAFLSSATRNAEREALFGDQPCGRCGEPIRWTRKKVWVHPDGQVYSNPDGWPTTDGPGHMAFPEYVYGDR